MALKSHAFLLDFPPVGKRIHLKAAAIGQHWPLPAIETVNATRLAQNLQARTQVEMVGVAKADLGADIIPKFVLVYGFDSSRRTNGHENGGIDLAVVGLDLAGSGLGVWVGVEELEDQG